MTAKVKTPGGTQPTPRVALALLLFDDPTLEWCLKKSNCPFPKTRQGAFVYGDPLPVVNEVVYLNVHQHRAER